MRNFIQRMCRYILLLGVIALPSAVIAAPKTPTGTSPGTLSAPGPSVASNSVTLKWDSIPTTTYYNVGVRDLTSNQLVVSATSTTVNYTANLQSGRQYRWNVAACNASGCSGYTTLLYFQTPSPPVVEYPLSVSTVGSGVVTGAGINCGAKCSGSYKTGTVVVLTATPTAGFTFAGWSGNAGCSGTQACSVTLSAAKTVTASFTAIAPVYQLVVNKNGNGSVNGNGINCGSVCSTSIKSGTNITLSAEPTSDSVFAGWTGIAGCSDKPSCSFLMTDSKSIVANFTQKIINYSISVTKTGNGTVSGTGINCGSSCSSTQQKGTSITLKAAASPGSVFLQWSGDCSGTSDTCTLSLQGNKSTQALFAPIIDNTRLRMSTTTKHVGVHMWLYNKSEQEIRNVIKAMKTGMFSDANAPTFMTKNGKTAQLSVQLEVNVNSFAHDKPEIFWSKMTRAINVLYSEGIVTHLLISGHQLPDDSDNWLGRSWSPRKWIGSSAFVPYIPCKARNIAGEVCTYDEIFENFHKPVIERLVQEKIADRLAVIYILNEFDYQNRLDRDTKPENSPWTKTRCGTQSNVEICRAEAIAYTTQRAIEITSKAASEKVPVGIKLPWFTPQGNISAFNPIDASGTKSDQLSYLLRDVLEPKKAVLGYDCYSPWGKRQNEMYCKSDYERIKAVLPERKMQDSLQNGRFELSEYAAYCSGSPNNLLSGHRTTATEMEGFIDNFPLSSGFSLFAFNASGNPDGCYALANPDNLVIYPGTLSSGSTIPGLGRQFNYILRP